MTDDEKAQKAAELSGIDLGQFMREVAEADPYGNGDYGCIFCRTQAPFHGDDCTWVKLRAAVPHE